MNIGTTLAPSGPLPLNAFSIFEHSLKGLASGGEISVPHLMTPNGAL